MNTFTMFALCISMGKLFPKMLDTVFIVTVPAGNLSVGKYLHDKHLMPSNLSPQRLVSVEES